MRPAHRLSPSVLLSLLGLLLVVAIVLGLGSGAVSMGPRDIMRILLDHVGIGEASDVSPTQDAVLWSIRLPRVLMGVTVGAALGVAGVAFQGIFRNPLADPQLIGVSSGAAVGSVVAVLTLQSTIGALASPIGGVVGAVAAAAAVFAVARHEGRTEVVTLVLAGLAVGAIAGSVAAFVAVASDDARLGSVLFYMLGSLGVSTWDRLWLTLPFVLGVVLALPWWARRLDLLLLGEREAMHLGVAVDRVRIAAGGLAAIAVGASVAATGGIGFVGLVVPHAIRSISGPGHRHLLPASALGGAAAVVLADVVARTVAQPLEVPIGLLTAIIGGPVFLVLVARTRREQGGWA